LAYCYYRQRRKNAGSSPGASDTDCGCAEMDEKLRGGGADARTSAREQSLHPRLGGLRLGGGPPIRIDLFERGRGGRAPRRFLIHHGDDEVLDGGRIARGPQSLGS